MKWVLHKYCTNMDLTVFGKHPWYILYFRNKKGISVGNTSPWPYDNGFGFMIKDKKVAWGEDYEMETTL